KFEVYKDRSGKFRFRLKASNGQVVATGEAYETKAAAKKGCESVLRAATGAPIEEVESETRGVRRSLLDCVAEERCPHVLRSDLHGARADRGVRRDPRRGDETT